MTFIALLVLATLLSACDASLLFDATPFQVIDIESNGYFSIVCYSDLQNASMDVSFTPFRFMEAQTETNIISHNGTILVQNPIIQNFTFGNKTYVMRQYSVSFYDNSVIPDLTQLFFYGNKMMPQHAGIYVCKETNSDSSKTRIVNVGDHHQMFQNRLENASIIVKVVFESTKNINATSVIETFETYRRLKIYQPYFTINSSNKYVIHYEWRFMLHENSSEFYINSRVSNILKQSMMPPQPEVLEGPISERTIVKI